MINVKEVNKLLTSNTDGKLVIRWFLTTPNGSLLAYTTPTDMRSLRDQVALVSMTWKQQVETTENSDDDHDQNPDKAANAHGTLILEFDNRNVLVRSVGPNLLLVLEGGVPPRRARPLRITVEGDETRTSTSREDPDHHTNAATTAGEPPINGHDNRDGAGVPDSPSAHSQASTTASVKRGNQILWAHRRKLEAMAVTIRSQFDTASFTMPPDPEGRFF